MSTPSTSTLSTKGHCMSIVPNPEYHLVGCLESMWHFGRVDAGQLDSEDDAAIHVLDSTSATDSLPASSLAFAGPPTISLMPDADVLQGPHASAGSAPSAQQGTEISSSPSSDQHAAIDSHPLHPLFVLLDEDGDAQVSLEEMQSLLRKLGKDEVSRTSLVSLLESVKPDIKPGAMALDFSQFTALYESLFGDAETKEVTGPAAQEGDDDLLDAFLVYDRNQDGFISASELAAVLVELGLLAADDQDGIAPHVGNCQALIDRVDSDGNGLVDLQEFKAMFMCSATSGPSYSGSRSSSEHI